MGIGELIKMLRESKNMTQSKLASVCLRSPDWLHLLEAGRLQVGAEDLVRIGLALDSELIVTYACGISAYKVFKTEKELAK